MIVTFSREENKLTVKKGGGLLLTLPATNDVRDELDGRRTGSQVVYTTPVRGARKPYQPRPFPSGIWRITDIIETDDPDYAPVIIKTDATRPVFIWELDGESNYLRITEEIQLDGGYWIHHNANSRTTWGCIRSTQPADALTLARFAAPELEAKHAVFVEVF